MLFLKFLLFLNVGTLDLAAGLSVEHCDGRAPLVQEGNLGQSGEFSWLGVLNVHLYDGDKYHTAVSGIVLIKIKHALANADDMVRIPQRIFKKSRAMFLSANNTPWYVAPASYVIHPEFESSSVNSIAIIELDLHRGEQIPLTPICLPTAEPYNSSYLIGFTDENQVLEKVIRRITYLDKTVCEDFYYRAGLSSQQRIPSAYLCGYAPSNVSQCVLDNGMTLVSNASGYFNLIGFTVYGPGCAAPARFIDLLPYFSWIHSVTRPPEDPQVTLSPVNTSDDYQREEDDDDDGIQFIPIHDLFRMKPSRRDGDDPDETITEWPEGDAPRHEYMPHPFNTDGLQHFSVEPTDDPNTLAIIPLGDMWENHTNACSVNKTLMYQEKFELNTIQLLGTVTYRLSLFDLHLQSSCILLTINCTKRSESSLSFKEMISLQRYEGLTPDELYRYPPPHQLKPEANDTTDDEIKVELDTCNQTRRKQRYTWKETKEHKDTRNPTKAKHLRPAQVEDLFKTRIPYYDLCITYHFKDRAEMLFQMYADTFNATKEIKNVTTTKRPKKTKQPPTLKPERRKGSRQKSFNHNMNEEDGEEIRPDESYVGDGSDRMQATSLAFVVEVQETMSAGYRDGATGLVVMTVCVISACLRWFFG